MLLVWTLVWPQTVAARPAIAQQTTGNITGRVLDEQGAGVPGATVMAKNGQTGFSRSETSDESGVYRLTGLPVGTYEIRIELTGFQPLTRSGIEVNVSQTLTLYVTPVFYIYFDKLQTRLGRGFAVSKG